jgi:hypothetical protein
VVPSRAPQGTQSYASAAPAVARPHSATVGSGTTSRRREIIQRVKRQAISKLYLFGSEGQAVEAKIIIAIEREFALLPVNELPEDELLVIALNICDGYVREDRDAQQRKTQQATLRRDLIREGRDSLFRQLMSVDDLEFGDKLRIERRVHAELERLSGTESLEDVEDLIDDILASEGIEWDDDDA